MRIEVGAYPWAEMPGRNGRGILRLLTMAQTAVAKAMLLKWSQLSALAKHKRIDLEKPTAATQNLAG